MDFFKKAFNTEVEPQKINNFPPFCPFMYMSLSECGNKKVLCIMGAVEYLVFCLIALANFVGAIISLTSKGYQNAFLGLTVRSACYLFFIPFVAFFVQFYPVYGACKSSNSLRYAVFFFAYFIGILFCILMAVGVPNVGGCGLIAALWELNYKNYFGATYQFVMMCVWIVNAIYMFVIMVITFKYFNEDGGSLVTIKDAVVGMFARNAVRSQIGV